MSAAGPAPDLTLEEARLLLEQHVRTTVWGRRGLAAKLPVESFARSGAFDVIFQSFIESRGTERAHIPYDNTPVDGPENGPAPEPWSIPLVMPPLFTPEERRAVRVPHTESVATCHTCNGDGRVTCGRCDGRGRVSCSSCGGDGRVSRTRTVQETNAQGHSTTRTEHYTESCFTCSGDGRVTCSNCGGDGRVTCSTCTGRCQLRHFVQLNVRWWTWQNSDQIENTALPDELVGRAAGVPVLHEEDAVIEQGRGRDVQQSAGPYRGGVVRVNAEVEAVANRLIAVHRIQAGDKLHRQRLVVRAVPVHEARYRWGKEARSFWIYGTDQQVHAPNFPRSPWRVGGAIALGLSVVAVPVGAVTTQGASPSARPRPAVTAAPAPQPGSPAAPVQAAPLAPQPGSPAAAEQVAPFAPKPPGRSTP